jgi:hypothetical protein
MPHLILFIWACIDTHKHSKIKRSARAKEMANGMVYGMIGGMEDKAHYAPTVQPLLTPSKQCTEDKGKVKGPCMDTRNVL